MLRRNARLRREYVFRKTLEGKAREEYEKKQKLKQALRDGTPLPPDLKADFTELKHQIDSEDAKTEVIRPAMDDEYSLSGITDPRVMITTSRAPSSRLAQFAKEMKLIFPNSLRVNRGSTVLKELVDCCRTNELTDLIILHEHRGNPDGMTISHLPFGPTAHLSLSNCVLRHDLREGIETMSEAYPHLIFHNFTSTLGARVTAILRALFPVPKPDSVRVLTFANQDDFISFRHHTFRKIASRTTASSSSPSPSSSSSSSPSPLSRIELQEVGPRFEMKLFMIKLGTVCEPESENEWVLRPYMHSAKKRKVL